MAASPSEFLTFYRRVARSSTLRQQLCSRSAPRRPFSSSISRFSSGGKLSTDSSVKTDQYPDSEHTTNKKDTLDVQSDNSKKGREAKSQDTGGSATTQSDTRDSTSKAKKDHPESPDVVIGMQDERGGKGH